MAVAALKRNVRRFEASSFLPFFFKRAILSFSLGMSSTSCRVTRLISRKWIYWPPTGSIRDAFRIAMSRRFISLIAGNVNHTDRDFRCVRTEEPVRTHFNVNQIIHRLVFLRHFGAAVRFVLNATLSPIESGASPFDFHPRQNAMAPPAAIDCPRATAIGGGGGRGWGGKKENKKSN